jgi:hypothetical protein
VDITTKTALKTIEWLKRLDTQMRYGFKIEKVDDQFFIDGNPIKITIATIRGSIVGALAKPTMKMLDRRSQLFTEIAKLTRVDMEDTSRPLYERLEDNGFLINDTHIIYPKPIPLRTISYTDQNEIIDIDKDINRYLISHEIYGITQFEIKRGVMINQVITSGIHPNAREDVFCFKYPLEFTFDKIMFIKESMSCIYLGSFYSSFYDKGPMRSEKSGMFIIDEIKQTFDHKSKEGTQIPKFGLITNNNTNKGGRIYAIK